MRRILISKITDFSQSEFKVEDFEADHLLKVLRLRENDQVECLDGNCFYFTGNIKFLGKGKILIIRNSEILSQPKKCSLPITLEMACIKGDAMDFTIEKSVEIGVKNFIPLFTDHSVVKLSSKSPSDFQIRWQKIADQSLKQCGRLDKMIVHSPLSLEEHFQKFSNIPRLWAFENESSHTLENALLNWDKNLSISLLIGPEGGFSEKEIFFLNKTKSQPVTLSSLILRAETAALVGSSLIASSMREWKK